MFHFSLKALDSNDRVIGFARLQLRTLFDKNFYRWLRGIREYDGSSTIGLFWHRKREEHVMRVLRAVGVQTD